MNNKCCLETHPEFGGCCCQCIYRVQDCSHPDTDGGSIMKQRGWVCTGFLLSEGEPSVFSDWSEHGMCELFSKSKEQFCDFCTVRSERLWIYEACDSCQGMVRKLKDWRHAPSGEGTVVE